MSYMKRKGTKKLSLDLNKEQVSEKVKTVILEQAKIIERLQREIEELRDENKELKKNFI